MKVCFLNLSPMNDSSGGIEKVFVTMANQLSDKGIDVAAFAADPNQGQPFWSISPQVKYNNVFDNNFGARIKWQLFKFFREIICALTFSKKSRHQCRVKFNINAKAKLLHKLIPKDADVYLSFQPEATYVLKHNLGINKPVVTMLHSQPGDYLATDTYALFEPSIEQTELVQVLQPEYVDQAKVYLKKPKVKYIPNFIDIEKNVAHKETQKLIVNVGRIGHQKRQLLSVLAFAEVASQYPDWKLELWGDTSYDQKYLDQLKATIASKGLQKQVSLCGTTRNMSKVLAKADVFLFPSAYEGFSLALGEAMMSHLPIVACQSCAGVNKLLENGNSGFLCEDTPEDIAQKLECLMKDADLRHRMGEAAYETIRPFTKEVVIDQWIQTFKEVIKAHQNRVNV